MDTNLEDSLNLDSDMGVDFDSSQDIVVHQDEMTLQGSAHESLPMEFEQIEEQPALMDTGNEEIIVSDFMGDQFSLQEYQTQDESISVNPKIEPADNVFTSEGEIYQDLQLGQHVMVPTSGVFTDTFQAKPKIVSVKAALPAMRAIAPKKQTVVVTKAIAPKQIAIAPKPPKLVTGTMRLPRIGKQFTIAPKPGTGVKPMTIIANKTGQVVKKLTIPTSQDSATGNAVLAIGKQLVMLPSGVGAGQKLKLVTSGGGQAVRLLAAHSPDKTQLISAQSVTGQQNPKQMMTKVVVQGSSSADQSAVLTKLSGAGAGGGVGSGMVMGSAGAGGSVGLVTGTGSAARFVMTPKTVPITLSGTKVVLGSPTKAGIRFTTAKKQQIVLKTPPAKEGMATKKIVLTANPSQGVAIKPALTSAAPVTTTPAPTLTATAAKQDLANKVPFGQKAQLHQINVPGKGVQYIRLVTNMGQAKPVVQAPKSSPNKTFVLTDNKGNRIQMEKVPAQPPPLVVTSGAPPPALHEAKVSPRPKLVKIAPVWSKQGQAALSRGGKSLLAPLTTATTAAPEPAPEPEPEPVALIEASHPHPHREERGGGHSLAEEHGYRERTQLEELTLDNEPQVCNPVDSKTALRQLIADTVGSDDAQDSVPLPHDAHAHAHADDHMASLYHNENSQYENGISIEQLQQPQKPDHPLIVIPSYMQHDRSEDSDHYSNVRDNSRNSPPERDSRYVQRQNSLVNIEVEPFDHYPPDGSPERGENDSGGELDLRPRKACNCTKSQCLKLYCDCFANGGFCHRCNCTNCHNNLENEQLRQKAIKGCLDRNPNAFRPKIGKSKTGGPETFRRHKKGCNCKRSGCLKNYCECYEAKIACTSICRCVGCRNVEESVERARRREARLAPPPPPQALGPAPPAKQPCSFMTSEVIEAVCQCLIAAAVDSSTPDAMDGSGAEDKDPIRDVIDEFARCLQDIISASNQATPLAMFDEAQV